MMILSNQRRRDVVLSQCVGKSNSEEIENKSGSHWLPIEKKKMSKTFMFLC